MALADLAGDLAGVAAEPVEMVLRGARRVPAMEIPPIPPSTRDASEVGRTMIAREDPWRGEAPDGSGQILAVGDERLIEQALVTLKRAAA